MVYWLRVDDLRGHLITTGGDGVLRTPPAEVDAIVEAMCSEPRAVLHFHGGLVSEEAGLRAAAGLLPTYRDAGAYPVFFIWRSGLLEIVSGNLREIANERAFKLLSKWVVKFAVGKLREAVGAKGAPLPTPSDRDVYEEIDRASGGAEPYAGLGAPSDLGELTPEQEAEVEQRLRADPELQALGVEIAESALPEEVREASKGVTVTRRLSATTLMSPDVVQELQREATVPEGEKGLVTSAALARKGVKVLARVIARFRADTDHGLYPTVVEELLAEFYLANAGAMVWNMMKKETLDTFEPGGDPPRGGSYFLERMGQSMRDGRSPQVTLVGHSTGAVFINNFLGTVARMRDDQQSALPSDFRFRNIAFLAPACTFDNFAPVLGRHEELWTDLRLFAMTDEAERADALVPVLYPRSLLYFVSGVCETDAEGARAAGKPLVGLRRHYAGKDREDLPEEIRSVLEYLTEERSVWSPVDGGPGLSASAVRHGDFDNDPKVRESLRVMIEAA
jgi:hypothetical protein